MPRQLSPGKARALGHRAVTVGARAILALLVVVAWPAAAARAAEPGIPAGAAGASTAAAEQGRYLAAAGNCLSCHTRPGGAPFSGGVPFVTPLGTIYSTNITPDAQTGIGAWTAADLRRALHEGRSRDGSYLFPAFPYPAFTKLSDADVAALYEYLRTVPAVNYRPPANGALFALRWPLALWNSLYFRSGRYAVNPVRSREWNRGAYLVEGPGHCGACHTPRNLLLAERDDSFLHGGALQVAIDKDHARRWSAVDLTPGARGLRSWSIAELTQYFRTGVSARAGTFGPMNEVIANSLSALSPDDLYAMAVYLKSLPPRNYPYESVAPRRVSEGAPIYKARCQKCHGSSGRGGMFSGPPLAGSAVVQAEDPASLLNIILRGSDAPKAFASESWETMPAYADVLDDAQIAAVGNFLRGSWGNQAGVVSSASVRAQR
jgi:alcohol dehydrogenase (quinone), cytochrome c subunit